MRFCGQSGAGIAVRCAQCCAEAPVGFRVGGITIIDGKLVIPRLRRSFLDAEPVRDSFRMAGRRAPGP